MGLDISLPGEQVVSSVLNLGATILDKIFPDPEQAAKAKLALLQAEQAGEFKQLDAQLQIATNQTNINVEEAKSSSFFVSGWRPAVGWTCVSGLAYSFLLQPLLAWITPLIKVGASLPPVLDMGTLLTLLFGILGLGTLRTKEKIEGVARK